MIDFNLRNNKIDELTLDIVNKLNSLINKRDIILKKKIKIVSIY